MKSFFSFSTRCTFVHPRGYLDHIVVHLFTNSIAITIDIWISVPIVRRDKAHHTYYHLTINAVDLNLLVQMPVTEDCRPRLFYLFQDVQNIVVFRQLARQSSEFFPTKWTRHTLFRLPVASAFVYALETARMPTWHHTRVRVCFITYWAFNDVSKLLRWSHSFVF